MVRRGNPPHLTDIMASACVPRVPTGPFWVPDEGMPDEFAQFDFGEAGVRFTDGRSGRRSRLFRSGQP